MKILIFEYVTGGGFKNQTIPKHLEHEARLMLTALLNNFASIENVELVVMIDVALDFTHPNKTILVEHNDNIENVFNNALTQCDAAWIIAPESQGILKRFCEYVELAGKTLLTSPSEAVTITGNKFDTYLQLKKYDIPTIETHFLTDDRHYETGEWIVKPLEGVGAEHTYIIADKSDLMTHLTEFDRNAFIIQPHVQGEKNTLSCLFKNGKAGVLCVNTQEFIVENQRYHLAKLIVNSKPVTPHYQTLVNQIAQAFPELWGYVGIDLIETGYTTRVLEINPRLTTSFAGIENALGINVARCVLELLTQESHSISPQHSKSITLTIL